MTPLGETAADTWDALLEGRYINHHVVCGRSASDLAIDAGRQAISATAHPLDDTALVVGTSKGLVKCWLEEAASRGTGFQPVRSASHGLQTCATGGINLSDVAADVASALGIDGPRLTISAACASGLHALIRGAMMIQGGEARRVLVVASEASVHPLFVGSFQRLGILANSEMGCRPFDEHRAGFLMSEAAAAVCLEADADGALGGVRVERFAMAADATHLTGSDPEGRALRHVLERICDNRRIDLFHAHGTGTPLNDAIELDAMQTVAREWRDRPIVYSHKAALGHSLGAAGLVSVVINQMCHERGVVPGNVRTNYPLPARGVVISNVPVRRPVRRSVVVAAGFGGPIGAVCLST